MGRWTQNGMMELEAERQDLLVTRSVLKNLREDMKYCEVVNVEIYLRISAIAQSYYG